MLLEIIILNLRAQKFHCSYQVHNVYFGRQIKNIDYM